MNDVLGMNELNSFTDLPHDTDASFLCQQKVFADCSIKQLAAVYTATAMVVLHNSSNHVNSQGGHL